MFALLFAVLLSFYLFINVREENLNSTIISFFLTLGIIISLLCHLEKPKAMDVYRGKTKVEITYKDEVVIDSTVVVVSKKNKAKNMTLNYGKKRTINSRSV